MHRCKPHRELIQRDLTCTMSKVWLNLWSPVSATGPEPKPPPSNLYHGQGKRTTAGVFWLQPKNSEAEASRFLAAWDMCFHIHMHHPCVYSWVYISIQRRKNKVFPRETGRVTEKTVFTAENWDILSLSHSLSLFTPRLCPPKFGGRCCIISKGFSSSAQPRVGWSTERLSVTFYLRFACRTNRRKTSAQSYIYLKTPPPSPPKKAPVNHCVIPLAVYQQSSFFLFAHQMTNATARFIPPTASSHPYSILSVMVFAHSHDAERAIVCRLGDAAQQR